MNSENGLFQQLLSHVGKDLNVKGLKDDLMALAKEKGLDPKDMSLNDLRDIVAAYARSVFVKLSSKE